jgi:transcription antitermination factor NusG
LFPGYCFARGERDDLRHVYQCPGVASVLSTAGAPAPVPDEEIEALLRLVRTDLPYEPCIPRVPGFRVRVVRGPLAGVHGRLIRGQRDSLLLSIELLNSAARLTISEWDVEPAPYDQRRSVADGALCRV